MTIPTLWSDGWTAALINHLWQSTAVAASASLLALMLRKNPARARYWLWMFASVKFLLPFSLLMMAGEWMRSLIAAPVVVEPALANVMEQVAQPFSQTQFFDATNMPSATHHSTSLPMALLTVWICGALVVAIRFGRGMRRVWNAKRVARPLELAAGVPVLCSPALLEPGIFGISRPVLLLPEGILERLTSEQMKAIVAHEMCHVRRRDNLTFAFHMVVETLFWFYPAVWWIGTRLIEEREIACDEAVLQAGEDAEDYAEGILNVCKFYVESPLACVAGVTGSDLKKRIARIVTERVAQNLDFTRKALLSAAGLAAIALPIVFGLVHAAQISAQSQAAGAAPDIPKFEVSAIKPTKSDEDRTTFMFRYTPDGISITGVPVQMLLRQAFGLQDDRIIGAPSWVKSDRFDIQAKVDGEDAPKLEKLTLDRRRMMLTPLLEDRFKLRFHHETRELPLYALVVAKGGPKLKESKPDDPVVNGSHGPHGMRIGRGQIESQGAPVEFLIGVLSQQVGRTIVNKTGLTGNYDFTLQWTPDDAPPATAGGPGGPPGSESSPPPDASGPSLFTALEEQLGLKLEPQKGPVDVIVIDHIEMPSPN